MTLQTPDLEAAKAMFLLQHNDDDNDEPARDKAQPKLKDTMKTTTEETAKEEVETKENKVALKEAADATNSQTFTTVRQHEAEPPSVETEHSKISPIRSVAPIDTNLSPIQCGATLTMSPVTTTFLINKKRSRSPKSPTTEEEKKHHKKSKTFFIGSDQDLKYVETPVDQSKKDRGKTLASFARASKRTSSTEESPSNTCKEEATKEAEKPLVEPPKEAAVESRVEATIPSITQRRKVKVNFVDLSEDPSDDEKDPPKPPRDEKKMQRPQPQRVGIHSEEMKLIHAIIQKLSGHAQETFKAIAAQAISRHQMGAVGYHHLPNAILRRVQQNMQPTDYMAAYSAVREELKANRAARKHHQAYGVPTNHMEAYPKDPYQQRSTRTVPMSRNHVEQYGGIRAAPKHFMNRYAGPVSSHGVKAPSPYAVRPPKQHIPQPYGTLMVCRPSPAPQYENPQPASCYPESHQSPVPLCDAPAFARQSPVPPPARHHDPTPPMDPPHSPSPTVPPHGPTTLEPPMYEEPLSKTVGLSTSVDAAPKVDSPKPQSSPSPATVPKNQPKKRPTKKPSERKVAPKVTKKATPKPSLKASSKASTKTALNKRAKVKELDLTIPSKAELEEDSKPDLQLALRYGYALGLKHGRSLPIHEILEQAEIKLAGMTTAERDSLSNTIAEYFKE